MGNQDRRRGLRTKTKNGEKRIRKDKDGEKIKTKVCPFFENVSPLKILSHFEKKKK